MVIDRSNGTTDWRYPHQDHLGSTVAVTNAAGQLLERYEYDAWGKRRNTDGTPSASQIVGATDRGYTGHEMLDSLGLIHMNGRVYDPLLGRFVSADPFIQAPNDLASYNRYSYVFNSPLSATDPSGYFLKWLERKVRREYKRSELFRAAVGIAAAWFAQGLMFDYFIGAGEFMVTTGGVSLTTSAAVTTGAVSGFAGGLAASGGDLKAAAQGALTGGAFGFVGGLSSPVEQYAGHALVGCASGAANGGGGSGCARGAASQVFSKWVTVQGGGGLIASTIAGGTASAITGGKFANGALTGAFGYLLNCDSHSCLGAGEPSKADADNAGQGGFVIGGMRADPIVVQATELTTNVLNLFAGAGVGVGLHAVVVTDRVIVGYIGVDTAGVVRYVGITENTGQRWAAHLAAKGTGKEFLDYSVVSGAEFVTRLQARIWEQKQIITYGLQKYGGQLLNMRNEIAQKFWQRYGISP